MTSNPDFTLIEFLIQILPRLKEGTHPPAWPPDVFGVCMAALLKSGTYTCALNDWPPVKAGRSDSASWCRTIEEIGDSWRKAWDKGSLPEAVVKAWAQVMKFGHVELNEVGKNTELCQTLLELCAMADEACEGAGIPLEKPTDEPAFYNRADKLLYPTPMGSSLCEEISQMRLRVLPKMRTPQNGLTVRSLSMHLSVCTSSEVKPKWFVAPSFYSSDGLSLNLLIVPWPKTVNPSQFQKADPLRTEMRNMPEDFGFFAFSPRDEATEVLRITMGLYEAAEKKLGRIDGIVFPELSLSSAAHAKVVDFALTKKVFLIAGVAEGPASGAIHCANRVCIDIPGMEALRQDKHHRWKLDGAQVEQYGLGSRLYPECQWWEHISLVDRQLIFVSMFPWLVMCPLICEDLARPDPIGDLVRAVGPNLVIAILMDGPQIKERWSARYATTLADDPGCSVLTVTSLGMTALSRPLRGGTPRPRAVALWKDSDHGTPVEIDLPPDADALVLSLTARYLKEWTADGRCDDGTAGCPVLSGIHTVNLAV